MILQVDVYRNSSSSYISQSVLLLEGYSNTVNQIIPMPFGRRKYKYLIRILSYIYFIRRFASHM